MQPMNNNTKFFFYFQLLSVIFNLIFFQNFYCLFDVHPLLGFLCRHQRNFQLLFMAISYFAVKATNLVLCTSNTTCCKWQWFIYFKHCFNSIFSIIFQVFFFFDRLELASVLVTVSSYIFVLFRFLIFISIITH